MKNFNWYLITYSLFLFTTVAAAGDKGLDFLRVGVGGQPVGMGEAYTASAEGAQATYWNPAGLAQGIREVSFSHNEWLRSIRGEFIGVSMKTGRVGWGWHLLTSHVDEIELREGPSEDPLGTFGSENVATGLSFAVPVNNRLDVGVTFKYLYEKIYVESASGFAVDLGALYRFGTTGLTGGMTLRHWGRMNELRDEATGVPATWRWGLAYAVDRWFSETGGITIAADYETGIDNDSHAMFGIEADLLRTLSARAGYQTGYDDRGISGGIGLRFAPVSFDYGITPYAADLGSTHRISIGFQW